MLCCGLLPAALYVALTAPLFAVPEPTAEELQANRAVLEQWRKHPEQLARLRRDLKAFLAQSAGRRAQVFQLDTDLHQQADSAQTRLMNVLERYVKWLERLSDADRRAIESAPHKAARLAIIRGLRDKEWIGTQ